MEILEARRLAVALIRRHGLIGWRLVFDNAKTRAGICRATTKEIGLSRVLTALHNQAEVTETILHEIAHALVGTAHGHDQVWQAKALAIGCSARRCVSSSAPKPAGAWVGVCPLGHRTTRHRQPTRVHSCGQCCLVFDPAALLDWTWKGRQVQMHPNYEAERRGIAERFAPGRAERPAAAVAARSRQPEPFAVGEPAEVLLPVGSRVRLNGKGKYAGRVGKVVKVGRSRYHVKTPKMLLTAPFAMVEPIT